MAKKSSKKKKATAGKAKSSRKKTKKTSASGARKRKTSPKKATRKSAKKSAKKSVKKSAKKTTKKTARSTQTRSRKAASKPKQAKKAKKARKAKKPESHLSKAELKHFRKRLLEKRREILGDMGGMQSSSAGVNPEEGISAAPNMPTHPADVGSDNFEHEFTLGLLQSERAMLQEIDEALERIENGTYGICLGTGQQINKPRLEARPWAKYCIEYARMVEKGLVRPNEEEERSRQNNTHDDDLLEEDEELEEEDDEESPDSEGDSDVIDDEDLEDED